MKKRIKNAGSFKRFYASGIPMYRERNTPFAIAANTMVNVIKVKTATAIVEVKCSKEQKAEIGLDTVILSVPSDNFLGDKLTREKAAKAIAKKSAKTPKAVAAEAPVVATEVAPEAVPQTVETAAVFDTAPAAPEVGPAPAAIAEPVTV